MNKINMQELGLGYQFLEESSFILIYNWESYFPK